MEDTVIKCQICHRTLKNSHNLNRHMKNIHGPTATKYQCSICNKTLSRRDVLNRHTLNIRGIQESKFKKTEIKRTLQKTIMTIAPPATWTPPPECRVKARLALSIPFKRTPKFKALTIDRASQIVFGHKGHIPPTEVTTEDLLDDLRLSPSPSSSSSTICLDEETTSQPFMSTVYGIFK